MPRFLWLAQAEYRRRRNSQLITFTIDTAWQPSPALASTCSRAADLPSLPGTISIRFARLARCGVSVVGESKSRRPGVRGACSTAKGCSNQCPASLTELGRRRVWSRLILSFSVRARFLFATLTAEVVAPEPTHGQASFQTSRALAKVSRRMNAICVEAHMFLTC